MPRPLRIEYAGAIYHLMNRGDRREPIFLDDQDRQTFLRTLQEACEKTDWQIHAFCLMGNHFHLVAETPQPNLVAGMKWLVVRAMKLDGGLGESFVVAADAAGAGVGETVLVTQGSSARQTELTQNKPVDAVIVAIVDDFAAAARDWAAFDATTVEDLARRG